METGFSLSSLLENAAEHMARDLRARLVKHPSEAGRARESILREFLQSHLARRFEVSTGFAFDASGGVSRQLDVVVADTQLASPFRVPGGVRFFPCETVVGVGQVKSSLDTRDGFREALENLRSAKELDRSSNGRAFDRVWREHLDYRENHLHQVFTFLFITGRSLSPETARDELEGFLSAHEPHLWPNVVIAQDRFLLTYCCEDGVCPNPMHALGLSLQLAESGPSLLLRFLLLLGRAIEVTRVSGLPYSEYLRFASQWDAEVLHSTHEPVPLLRDSL